MMLVEDPLACPRISLILLVALLLAAPQLLLGQGASGSTQGKSAAAPDDQTTQMEEESAERDVTYITSRLVYRYDYKSQAKDVTANRIRLKGLYSFGPKNRLAFALTIPVVWKDVPGNSASGLSDIQAQFGGNFYYKERFRTGAAVQITPQTSTDDLLGGSSTTVKSTWGFTSVLTRRNELNATFNYNRSIHTTRGSPKNEFEPDISLNTHRFGLTWYGEWDSFYPLTGGTLAQTLKFGASRRLSKARRWVFSPYYSFPLNDAGRNTQYVRNVGLDVSWFPGRKER
jgi:hypothetical protein